MPGLGCGCLVGLSRGVFSNDDAFVSWEYCALIPLGLILNIELPSVSR